MLEHNFLSNIAFVKVMITKVGIDYVAVCAFPSARALKEVNGSGSL